MKEQFETYAVFLIIYIPMNLKGNYFIYIKNCVTLRGREESKNLPSTGLLLRWLQKWELSRLKPEFCNSIQILNLGGRGPSTLAVIYCIPKYTSWDILRKEVERTRCQCSNMWCLYQKQSLLSCATMSNTWIFLTLHILIWNIC